MLKKFTGDALVFGIGSALSRFAGLLAFPIFAKLLSPEEFARQDLVLSFLTCAAIFFGLGLRTSFTRLYYEEDNRARGVMLTSWLVLILISAIAIILVALNAQEYIANQIINDELSEPLILWGSIGLIFALLAEQPMMVLRLRRHKYRFISVSILGSTTTVITAVLLIHQFENKSLAVIIGYMLGHAMRYVAGTILTGWIWAASVSLRKSREMLTFGLPLVPAAAALWAIGSLGRFIIQHEMTPLDTATYGIAAKLGSMIALLWAGFSLAWGPFAFSLMDNPSKAALVYSRVASFVFFIGGVAMMSISVYSPELIVLLAQPRYADASQYVPILTFNTIVWTFLSVACVGYQYAKKTYHQTIGVGIGCAVFVVIINSMTKALGVYGVVTSSTIAALISVGYCTWASQKYLKVDFKFFRICGGCFIMFIFSYGTMMIPSALSKSQNLVDLSLSVFCLKILILILGIFLLAYICLGKPIVTKAFTMIKMKACAKKTFSKL